MSKPAIVFSVVLLVSGICLAPVDAAEPAGKENLWTSYRDMMKGRWVTDGVLDEGIQGAVAKGGDKFRMQSTFWSALDGNALIGRQTFRIKGRSGYSAQSHYVAGWNPNKKVIDIRVYWSDGNIDEATITGKEGNAFLVEYTFTGGTGAVTNKTETFAVVDDNTLTWGSEPNKSTWKRRTTTTGTTPAIDLVEYYSYFVGEWKVTSDDVEGEEGVFVVKLGPSGKCHVTQLKFGEQCGEGVYGPDPLTGRWTGTGFEADGTFWQSIFSPPKKNKLEPGDSFTSRGTRKTVDGSKTADVTELTIIDENTFTAESPEATFRLTRK